MTDKNFDITITEIPVKQPNSMNCVSRLFQCYEWALRKCQQLDWSEDSAKAFVMIGDCLPHQPGYTDQNIFWLTELDILIGMGVKVNLNHMLFADKFVSNKITSSCNFQYIATRLKYLVNCTKRLE